VAKQQKKKLVEHVRCLVGFAELWKYTLIQAKQRPVVMEIPLSTGFDNGAGPNRTSNWHFYNLRQEN
jgi:hypothetical protein